MINDQQSQMQSVLIVGMSTRAAAESAARAGYDVTALDAFADLDQHPSVRALSLPRDFRRPFSPRAAADAARSLSGHAAVYLSPFDNAPDAVRTLRAGRMLWGTPPEALCRVRDPRTLSDIFCRAGVRAPITFLANEPPPAGRVRDDRRWLLKPLASGGGHGVRSWTPGSPVPRGCYLQELIEGIPGSVVFTAAGGRAVALAATRQLVGEGAFGASGFRYCGSILSSSPERSLSLASRAEPGGEPLDAVIALADIAARAFALSGLCGIDFIVEGGVPRPIELNPRWSSSMELVERAWNVPMFAIHADACTGGELPLPAFDVRNTQGGRAAHGKAIVFARSGVVAGDTRPWLGDSSVRDVPRSGEHIAAGQPICTVFASAPDEAACRAMLVRRAEEIYDAVRQWARASIDDL